MRSFLGVPIVAPEGVIGAFYLTEKEAGERSTRPTRRVIELLAAHAAIAIANAGLYERSRELSMLAERNRLALELHDAVSQKLFSLVLTAEAAGEQLERDPRRRARRSRGCARSRSEALEELRALIHELRPPELERDGLCGALRKHVEMLRRLHRVEIELDVDDDAAAARGRATARSSGSPRRRCRTRSATRAPARLGVRLGRRDGRWSSRSPTTARASTPPTRSCARAGSG